MAEKNWSEERPRGECSDSAPRGVVDVATRTSHEDEEESTDLLVAAVVVVVCSTTHTQPLPPRDSPSLFFIQDTFKSRKCICHRSCKYLDSIGQDASQESCIK